MGVTTVAKDYGTELLNAIRDNDYKTFKAICEKHLKHDKQIADLCTMDIKHRPSRKFACPLILAARLEDPSIIKYMMEVGTNPNFVHQSVYTTGKRDLITPLHIAVDLGLMHTADILLNFNADPNVLNHNGDSPFMLAIKKSDWVLMKMMLTKGGDASLVDSKGNAPLHMATLHGHLQMVKTLLKHNADVHQKGYLGAIPSHIAAREGHIHLVQVFCSADLGLINTRIPCFSDGRDKAPIHLASERGHAETVVALIDQFNADVNLKDSHGNTPLHCVVLYFYQPNKMRDKDYFYATAKILLKYKAAANERNHAGQTALHLASANNHPKIVELLLSVGANAFAEDNNRMKPIDVVPEADAVSKQLLKTAMSNPKPPMNASNLSLTQNSSFHLGIMGDINATKNSFLTRSMLESNGGVPVMKPKNYSMASSMSSIYAGNARHPHSSLSPKQRHVPNEPQDSPRHRGHPNLPDYSYHHGRKHHQRRRRRRQSSTRSPSSDSNLPSVFSYSSQDLYKRSYRNYSGMSSDDDTLRDDGRRRRRRSDSRQKQRDARKNDGYSRDDRIDRSADRLDRSAVRLDRSANRLDRSAVRMNRSADRKRSRREGRHENLRSRGDVSESIYSDDEGIRVHKFPGKPSTIEVEYMNGPITIEFENQDEPTRKGDEAKQSNEAKLKKVVGSPKKKHRRVPDDNKESLNDWFNEMTKYNKDQRKQKGRRRDEDEDEYDDDGDDGDELKLGRANEETRPKMSEANDGWKRKKKSKWREMKQREYEEQLEMEKLPIVDPEPPAERLRVVDDDESPFDDSSFDSESFEEKLHDTRKVLNDSASKRILEVMRSVQTRWSQDESDDDDDDDDEAKASSKGPNKKIPAPRKPDVKDQTTSSKPATMEEETYHSNFTESLQNEVIKMETIAAKNAPGSRSLAEENRRETLSSSIGSPKKGLNMRIVGETPKAYTRKGKASARAMFILATPARIESSSEASDSEQSIPSASLRRRADWGRPLTPIFTNPSAANPVRAPSSKSNGSEGSPSKGVPAPYKSFGKIETKTDALEEALDDDDDDDDSDGDDEKVFETSFNTEASTEISPAASKIFPENYRINKKSMVTSFDYDPEGRGRLKSTEESQRRPQKKLERHDDETKIEPTRFAGEENSKKALRRNASLEDLLETYSEEPSSRRRKHLATDKDPQISSHSSKTRNKIKIEKPMVTKFPLPDGFSPEVWEEASSTSPLASSDTYALPKKNKGEKKLDGETKTKKNQEQRKKTTNSLRKDFDPRLSLDVFVPTVSDVSNRTLSDLDDSLNVKIPLDASSEDDTKEAAKKSKRGKISEPSKSGSRRSGREEKVQHYAEVLPSKQSGKVKKPPMPRSPHQSKPFALDERGRRRRMDSSVEDLNELPYAGKMGMLLPRYPNRPYYVDRMGAYSDTEMNATARPRRDVYYAHSEAEVSDFELPRDPRPGTSYKEAALKSLNSKELRYRYRSLLLRHPGHHDKNFDYIHKLYRPRKRRVRTAHLFPRAGKYGDKEFRRVCSNQSFTESESEIDPNRSFLTDDEAQETNASARPSTPKLDKMFSPIYESLMRFKRIKETRAEFKRRENEPIASLEPEGFSFEKYDAIAKIWMEQVDRETVLKSNTMYFTVLPEGRRLPDSLLGDHLKADLDASGTVPQWVVARTRFVFSKEAQNQLSGDSQRNQRSGVQRHLILFFKIGFDWMELAWVLFDGLLKESEVVRLIKDIQIKHPSSISEQVSDLMRRWWYKKGDQATIQELQRALDLIQMFYIQEEIINKEGEKLEVTKYSENEDNLDTGEIADNDPNVTQLCQDYNSRSLNSSFFSHSIKSSKYEPSSDRVLRKLQVSTIVPAGTNESLARVNRPSSRNHDFDRSTSTAYKGDTESFVSSPTNEATRKKKKKTYKNETNL